MNSLKDNFPQEFVAAIYRNLHADLVAANLSDDQLKDHFEQYGKLEGRVSNSINTRIEFLSLLPASAAILEIGPFFNPVVRGDNVRYFDVLNRDQLVVRAKELNGNPDNVPEIQFVHPKGDLAVINEKFDIIISSHSIEHQPDLVVHLQKVEKLLNPGGFYFCLVPDKRYCFDHFIPETTIAEVLYKHHEQVKVHSLKNIVEHLCLTTHNDCVRHWQGDHGAYCDDFASRYETALQVHKAANGGYVDVHASYFTPDSFAGLMVRLQEIKLTNLNVVRCYHTRKYQLEFYVIMERQA